MQQYQDLKFVTALHVSTYSAIIRCVQIPRNFCAFCATAIGVFAFIIFLNEVDVLPPSMPHLLSLHRVMINYVSTFFVWTTFKLYIVSAVKCVRTFGMPVAYEVCSVML
jgi:hypothetical protein